MHPILRCRKSFSLLVRLRFPCRRFHRGCVGREGRRVRVRVVERMELRVGNVGDWKNAHEIHTFL
jgi:hypothetical protein